MKNIFFIILLTLGLATKFDEFPFLMTEIDHNSNNETTIKNKISDNKQINNFLKCSDMNQYFEDLIKIDYEISEFRNDLLKFNLKYIDNDVMEEMKTSLSCYFDKFNSLKINLSDLKEHLSEINYTCDQLFFIVLNIENHINNVEYLLENESNKYHK